MTRSTRARVWSGRGIYEGRRRDDCGDHLATVDGRGTVAEKASLAVRRSTFLARDVSLAVTRFLGVGLDCACEMVDARETTDKKCQDLSPHM